MEATAGSGHRWVTSLEISRGRVGAKGHGEARYVRVLRIRRRGSEMPVKIVAADAYLRGGVVSAP
jgi:hypothetical protein